MKEEKQGFHLVMALALETSMPLSNIANCNPLHQSTTIRLGRTSSYLYVPLSLTFEPLSVRRYVHIDACFGRVGLVSDPLVVGE